MGRSSHSIPQGISVFAPVREGLCNPTVTYTCVIHYSTASAFFCLLLHPAMLLIPKLLHKLSCLLTLHCAGELITFNSSALRCSGSCTMKDRPGCYTTQGVLEDISLLLTSTATRGSATHCLPMCCWPATEEISWDSRKGPSACSRSASPQLPSRFCGFQLLLVPFSLEPPRALSWPWTTQRVFSDTH